MSTKIDYTATALEPAADRAFEEGVAHVRATRPEHRLLIGGAWVPGGDGRTFLEANPADTGEILGSFAEATAADVQAAVAAARRAQPAWRATPVEDRIAVLQRVAALLGARAGEVAATATLEVGKNRLESMGEVDEAVALIDFYAQQAAAGFDIPLATADPGGQENRSVMRPFGVFGVIAPFNFPLALVLGPAVAALLTGNTVVVKPSPTTSAIAILFAELLLEAGLPDGALNLVTGGDEAGRALVASAIDGIVFTGSYDVGQAITRSFTTAVGYARPSIIEMGGKNPAIVTAHADLGRAAAGIARSAFGLSGQKCSACSRVLVSDGVHDAFLEALVAQAREWTVGDPVDAGSRLGPVHTAASRERFVASVAAAVRDGEVVVGGGLPAGGGLERGLYVEPTVVAGLPAGHALIREELFVPLVVVERVTSLDEALARANDQLFGLTAGMFSEEPEEVERFLETIEAGTLFVNRAAGATTGGWPGQQTYPGWKGSGSTNRGGLGPRYVQQFLREQGRNVVVR